MKNRSNVAASILQSPETLESAYKSALGSAGSAQEELNKYLESAEAKVQKLKNQLQEFWNTLLDSGTLKTIISSLTTILEKVTELVDTLGTLGTLGLGLSAFLGIKNVGIFKTFNSDIDKSISKIGMFNKSFWAMQQDLKHGNGIGFSIFGGQSVTSKDKQSILDLNTALKNGVKPAKAWATTMTNCSIAAQNQARQCLRANGNLTELANGLDTTTASAKAAEIGLKALSVAGNMLLMWGISEAIQLIGECANASNRLKESAQELGSAFSSTKSDIDNYKTQIADLYKVINDNTSSYEDTYTARQNLLSIQDEMIEKFGDEAEAVSLITQAVNGSTDALDTLTQDKWEETKNKFNFDSDKSWTEKFGDTWANLLSGSSNNFQRMIKEMEDTEVTFHIMPMYGDETYEEFSKKLKEDYGASITRSNHGDMFTLSGNLDDIYDQLLNIKSLATDMGIEESFLNNLFAQAESTKTTLESYENIYNKHVLYDKIFGDSESVNKDGETYEEVFNKINNEYKKYQEAFATGDEEIIEKAKQNFAEIVQQSTEGISDQSVVDYFNSMYPDLQDVVGAWEFEVKFKAAVEDDNDDFENRVQNAVSQFNTVEDIKNYNPKVASDKQISAYAELKQVADEYNLTLDQLIDKLVLMGLIQNESYQQLVNKFGQDAVDKLTPEDLEIAYTISSEEADKALEQEKNKIKSELESLSKEGNVDLTIRPVIDSSVMQAAGWDVEDGSIATTFTQGEFIWQGDEENGQYVYVHYTPILPDGTVLTPDEATDYLYGTLEGSQSVLDADNKGIVLKVDTDLNIPEGDIKKFTNGEGSTDAIDGLIQKTGEWDDKVHGVQEQYYDTGEGMGYASNALDGLIKKHKQLENSDEITVSFIDTLNSADYAEIKDELLELAKSGEITPETLSSTKEYAELLSKTDTSAESAMNQILDLLTAQEKLAGFSQGLDKLKSAYEEFKDEDIGFVTAETLQSLPDAFKKLPEFDLFSQIVGDPTSGAGAIQQAFNDIVKAYMLSQDVLQGLVNASEHDIQSYIANFKQMGVTNAEEVVNLAVEALNSENELLNSAEAEYIDYLNNKEGYDTDYLKSVASKNGQLASALGEAYKADYDNWCDLLEKKSELYNEFIKRIGNSYNPEYSVVGNMSANGQNMSASNIAEMSAMQSQIYQTQYEADRLKDQLKVNLAPINTDFGTHYSPSTKDGSGSSKDNQSKETIDFIEIAIKRIEEAIDKLKTKAENTFIGFEIRTKHYASLLGKVTDEINLQSQAYQAYMARANSVGLSEVYASQIRDGSLNIVDITDDKLKEQIKDYQTWYEKAKECQDKVEELKITQTELTQANLELLITKYEKLAEKVSSANDRIQGKLDLKEAWGFHATSGSYTSMNKNIIKQIDYIKKQDEELKKLLNTVEKGSEAWLEYQSRLDDNKKSFQDLTKEMAENAKAAAELSGAKAERKVEKYDKSDEKLDAKINNSIKYKNQNRYLNTEMNNIDRRQNAYDKAVETDKKGIATTSKAINKTKSNKENKSILKKIKSLVKQKKIISESLLEKASKLGDNGVLYDKCVRYNAYISAYEIDKDIADLYRETSQQDKADIAQRKLDNIQTYYKNRQGENNQKAEQLNARIEMAKESGYVESATLYNQLSSVEKQNNTYLRTERDKLQESLAKSLLDGSIKKNSDEWYEMCQQIDDVTNEIDQSDLALKQYQNTLRQMKWDSFDYLQGKISNVTSEMDFMINELSREDLTSDDIGGLTDEGNAVAYLRASKYETLKNQLADYYAELETLEKTEDQYDTKVIERKEELRQSIQDTTSAVQDEKWAIIDLYTQGYEALSNKIKDLIDEYGELLDAEKEAYDWQNTIADKTKEIASIRKQLSAYANDSSEETKAKIQQLNVSLEEAEKDLKDSQYDKFISDTKEMLSDLQEDMDNNIQSIIDNLDKNFEELMASIGENATTSAETVKSAMTGIGYQPSEDFSTMLSTTLEGSSIKVSVDKMITGIDNLVEILKKRAEENAKGADTTTASEDVKEEAISKQQGKVDTKKEKYEKALEEYNKAKKETSKLKTKMDDIGWIYGIDSKKYKNANEKYKQAKKNRDTLKSSMNSAKKEYEDELAELEKLKKYSVGSKHITKDQLAWTQDGGQELVYRSNDGAILTRLGEGDKVFTNEMSENLWKLAQLHPADFMNGIGNVKLPDVTRNVTGGDVRIEFGDLVLPDVTNSAEFANSVEGVMRNAICKNGKTAKCFTEAVSSMQMGRGIGNARLYK